MKSDFNPMNLVDLMSAAPSCTATSKRSGTLVAHLPLKDRMFAGFTVPDTERHLENTTVCKGTVLGRM